ncbi:MAG: hypothetical protein M3P01_10095 [Actinomycetota bacterium]|nr:hypothetical protein [Actinomycetota bacterium]
MIPLRAIPDQTPPPVAAPTLLEFLSNWEPERLLVLGSGPLPIDGVSGGALAIDARGDTVLGVAADTLMPRAPVQIADELDRLAQMSGSDLRGAETPPGSSTSIEDRFAEVFGASPSKLNRRQAAILMVGSEPPPQAWKTLTAQLGPRLRGVYLMDGNEAIALALPQAEPRPATTPTPVSTRLAAGAVALGLVLALVAIVRIVHPAATAPSVSVLAPSVRTVATGVPGGATHTQWIGQQHIVHTTEGKLLMLFEGHSGLNIVSDGANGGATWGTPVTVTSIHPQSFAAAMDGNGRLHMAFSDGHGVAYAVLSPAGAGWRVSQLLRLDSRSRTPLVDLAWDEPRHTADVVWAKDTANGQQPFWAAVRTTGGTAGVIGTRAIAPSGKAVPVLVNEAVDPVTGSLMVTYRDGTSEAGWRSRTATPLPAGGWRWNRIERLPTHAFIGAAALAIDQGGMAHLVLRDSTDYRLLYFTRPRRSTWSKGEIAVQAHATSQVDFPALALDDSSKLVYLFFESDQFETSPEIRVAVRDPDSGWQQSTSVAALPQGNYFPTSLRNANGQALAVWTRGGSVPSVESARVSAP